MLSDKDAIDVTDIFLKMNSADLISLLKISPNVFASQ
jgi:hypothetical protein